MDFRSDGLTAAANTEAASTTSLTQAEHAANSNPAMESSNVQQSESLTSHAKQSLTDPHPHHFHLRAPLLHRRSGKASSARAFTTPNIQWLAGTWHVTHTSLPLWNDKRNTRITYTALPDDKIDDLVQYQMISSSKIKTIEGIDTPNPDAAHDGGGAWKWRGKGWLKIATSDWEILGWGDAPAEDGSGKEQWVVTYFSKTLFTPPGIDLYARTGKGHSDRTFDEIKKSLERLGEEHADIKQLVQDFYAITRDDSMDK